MEDLEQDPQSSQFCSIISTAMEKKRAFLNVVEALEEVVVIQKMLESSVVRSTYTLHLYFVYLPTSQINSPLIEVLNTLQSISLDILSQYYNCVFKLYL